MGGWRSWTKGLVVVLAAWLAAAVFLGAGAASASQDEADRLVAAINASRSSLAGAGALRPASDLAAVAARQAAAMAAAGAIFHNQELGTQVTGWEVVGENVGVGPDVDTLHAAFVDSPGHRANLLDARFTEIGVGIARSGDSLWVVEVFRQPAAPAAAGTPAAATADAPAPAPAPAPKRVAAPKPAAAPAAGPAVAAAGPARQPAPVAAPAPSAEPPSVVAPDVVAEQAPSRWGEVRLSPTAPAAPARRPSPALSASDPAPARTGAGWAAGAAAVALAARPAAIATALWLAVALLTVDHLRRRAATGLRVAGLSLQAA